MIQNQPYFQQAAYLPELQTNSENYELQPDTQVPRDDYFTQSHYTWYHDDSDESGSFYPAMYQQQQQWNPHTQGLGPAMYNPLTAQAQAPQGLSPAMVHPWVPQTQGLHGLSPTMYHPGFPGVDDCDPHGWDHYSVDYHHDWYHPRYYQAQGYYPAGYRTWDGYYW
ncbi:hypothetical protein KZ483_16940 [Paenibacillus sp. sptzw28]|uniref:hypothetical protein n=1 Tax=Paenibacillus sp. sptzw28 TaxID=715179 RepID=UPI001C6F2CE9|nr:hypothetical protein [Paenibacillus sp. sptzw28]QYR19584.1 hypothetical protein KZ483_16940 [Paenibacillus sp. sptzw28]